MPAHGNIPVAKLNKITPGSGILAGTMCIDDGNAHGRSHWSTFGIGYTTRYDKDEIETIKDRIVKAAKKHDIEIDPETRD